MRIKYKKEFIKKYAKSPAKVQKAFDNRLRLFKEDPYHPILNNHFLTGKYKGCKSINVTGNRRAIFKESQDKSLVIFLIIGAHPQLYG